MITNTLLLKLKNHDADIVQKTQDVLLSMQNQIEVLREIQVEINIRPSGSNYDLMLITKFESLMDFDSYLAHPAHLEVAKFIGSVLDTQASLCYETK
jgi:hypothetical protein